jgi:hypothetical protein
MPKTLRVLGEGARRMARGVGLLGIGEESILLGVVMLKRYCGKMFGLYTARV